MYQYDVVPRGRAAHSTRRGRSVCTRSVSGRQEWAVKWSRVDKKPLEKKGRARGTLVKKSTDASFHLPNPILVL